MKLNIHQLKLLLLIVPLMWTGNSFAAAIMASPSDNLQAKLDAAANGTLTLGAGTFSVDTPLVVHSGTTIQGAANFASHVVFNLRATDLTYYGLQLDANAGNVKIQGVDLISNHGVIGGYAGSSYANLHIVGNNFQYGGGTTSNGTGVFGIVIDVACPGLQLTYNNFHDSPASNRNWVIWFPSNANIDHNLFGNVYDGGQLNQPGANVSFSYNFGTKLQRMGQEIAMSNTPGLRVVGNVFYDWVSPYYNSFGISVVVTGTNPLIDSNFIRLNIAQGAGWGQTDGPNGTGTHRFGYAIECGGTNCVVSNNTLIAPNSCASFVSSCGLAAQVNNNKVFGSSLWGNFAGEPGPNGNGSVVVNNSPVDVNANDAPAPPANTFAGPDKNSAQPQSAAPVSAPQANGITNLQATVLNDTTARLDWINPQPIASADINIVTTQGRLPYPALTLAGNVATATISNLTPQWQYDYSVTGTTSSGATFNSSAVTAQQTGTSTGPASGNPTLSKQILKTVTTTLYEDDGIAQLPATVIYYRDGTTAP